MNVWTSRTGGTLQGAFLAMSQSVEEDAVFLPYDVQGSIAHVHGLHHVGLIDTATHDDLVAGLQAIAHDAATGAFELDPALEDVHMNIEAALTKRLGDAGKRLHTGRSRNDQVATCIVLFSRDVLQQTAAGLHGVAQALARQAGDHPETPWVATTHGQPAQPASLPFLLMAHAERFHAAATQCLQAFDAIGHSPLGSGAVAGSTLPLDPAYTADLLGLEPPRNALLETGGRDAVLTTLQALTAAGTAVASLAEDLFGLFGAGALELPNHLTTGSSLMPQKRNPDALELLRGHSMAIAGHEHAVRSAAGGLGLGYVRDLQVVKPHLAEAAKRSLQCLAVLTECVEGAAFDDAALGAQLTRPGITATDAAEALVAHGVPFRDAYHAIAQQIASGEALTGFPAEALAAAEATIVPDPGRRATLGGPAPHVVAGAVTRFHHNQSGQALQIDAAFQAIQQAASLAQIEVLA